MNIQQRILSQSINCSGFEYLKAQTINFSRKVLDCCKTIQSSINSESESKLKQSQSNEFDYSILLEDRVNSFEGNLGDYAVRVEKHNSGIISFTLRTSSISILEKAFKQSCNFLEVQFQTKVHVSKEHGLSIIACDSQFFGAQEEFETIRAIENCLFQKLSAILTLCKIYHDESVILTALSDEIIQFYKNSQWKISEIWEKYGYHFLAKLKTDKLNLYFPGENVLTLFLSNRFQGLKIANEDAAPLLEAVGIMVTQDEFWKSRISSAEDCSVRFENNPEFPIPINLKKLALFLYTEKLLFVIAFLLNDEELSNSLLIRQNISNVIFENKV